MNFMKISGRNIKYKLNKSWKGSYTVEAAVLFPIILGILVLVLYLAFYLSDLAVLDNLAWKLALEGSLAVSYNDAQEIERELYEKANAQLDGRTLCVRLVDMDLQVTEKEAKVTFYGKFVIPGLPFVSGIIGGKDGIVSVERTAQVRKPAGWIRNIRKLEGMVHETNGTDTRRIQEGFES
ncbi:TadE family protein [Diplocloster agilis]|uniref:TadE family protein n=1 Tax=Diplocloster agilis TaxID=2850323 RepID=UPI001EE818BD|nr:TadE family protein [Diplocloster agilis]